MSEVPLYSSHLGGGGEAPDDCDGAEPLTVLYL